MIQDKMKVSDVQSTLKGEKIGLSIDPAAMAHIMNVLTDLYSDPELAVIREYSTNAWDAHVEAGNPAPIEVYLPGPLAPFLKIKDFGIGLSVDDIHEIYSRYGASTKRATNEQVGTLGLGCKSALTYADQFTLTSTKNGTRVTVVVSRDDDGSGSMTVEDTRSVDKPDGTEVIIPCRAGNRIALKAKEFFSYWPEGTVLVDGQQPKRFEHTLKLSDDFYIVKHTGYTFNSGGTVVMGNVPYPAKMAHQLPYGFSPVVYVPIGDVNFTPSREALHYDAKTNATITRVLTDLRKKIAAKIQELIDAAPNEAEALALTEKWANLYNGATYKGRPFPSKLKAASEFLITRRDSHVLSRCSKYESIMPNTRQVWVVNYDRPNFTAAHKKKLNKWAETCGFDVKDYVLIPESAPPEPEWFRADHIIDWKTVEQIKLPRLVSTGGSSPAGTYDIYTDGHMRYNVTAGELSTFGGQIYWVVGNTRKARRYANNFDLKDSIVVGLGLNRVEKFKRLFPKAIDIGTMIEQRAKKFITNLTDSDKEAMRLQEDYGSRALALLDEKRIDDPELKRQIKLAKKDLTKLTNEYNLLSAFVPMPELNFDPVKPPPLEKYPLLTPMRHSSMHEHVYLYINMIYAKEKSNGKAAA